MDFYLLQNMYQQVISQKRYNNLFKVLKPEKKSVYYWVSLVLENIYNGKCHSKG